MAKCNFNKVALQLHHTSAQVFSFKYPHIFRTLFYKDTSGGILLQLVNFSCQCFVKSIQVNELLCPIKMEFQPVLINQSKKTLVQSKTLLDFTGQVSPITASSKICPKLVNGKYPSLCSEILCVKWKYHQKMLCRYLFYVIFFLKVRAIFSFKKSCIISFT